MASPDLLEKEKKPAGPRKKATNEKREEKPLEADQILKSQTGTEYLVESKLGAGGFGEVWKVSLLEDPDKRFAMKTEKNLGSKEMRRLKCEVNLFEEIERASNAIEKRHFVKMHGKGKTVSFKYYIMDLIWLSLKDVKQTICGDVFTPHTKIKIGRQTLKSIESLHEIGYLHRDIKPANYAVGLPPMDTIIYLLDFGIARPYREKDGTVRKARKRVRGLGTQLYMSMECLCQNEQSRRDDLEVWMYMMIEFYDRTNLLWWNLEPKEVQQAMNLREELMMNPRGCLAEGKLKVPEKWCDIIEYLNGMAYDEPGDFVQINLFLTQICIDENIDENLPLDWAGKKPKSPERPKKKEEKKEKKKEGGVRKKATAHVKEVKEDEGKKPRVRQSNDDSEIGTGDGESGDNFQEFLRWKKKRRSNRRKKPGRGSNDQSEKKCPSRPRKKPSAGHNEEKDGEGKEHCNEHAETKKEGDKAVPEKKICSKKRAVKTPEQPHDNSNKDRKKVEPARNSQGTPGSNESNDGGGEKKFERKKRLGSKGSGDDDEKEYQRKKNNVRKLETNKKNDRKKATKRKSIDDPNEDKKIIEKSPLAKPVAADPKRANEIKKK